MAKECFSVFVYYKGPSGVNWPNWGEGEFIEAKERLNGQVFREREKLERFLDDRRKEGWELYLYPPAVGDLRFRQEISCERS